MADFRQDVSPEPGSRSVGARRRGGSTTRGRTTRCRLNDGGTDGALAWTGGHRRPAATLNVEQEVTVVSAYEQPGQHTVVDWRRLDQQSDGPRFELINGRFVVKPVGDYLHRGLVDSLCLLLRTALRQRDRGELRARSGLGITLGLRHAVLADVAVVRHQPEDATALSAADLMLAVDVVGPRTREQDQAGRRAAYAAAGVRHVWRLEPGQNRPPTVLCLELARGEYVERLAVRPGEPALVTSAPVPVWVDVDQLYAEAM